MTDLIVEKHLRGMKRAGLRPSTIGQRRYVLARLIHHTRVGLLDVTEEQIEVSLDRLTAAHSRAAELSHIKQFYAWAYDLELIDVNPAVRLKRPKTPRRLPRPMSEDDLAHAIEEAPLHVGPMLLFAAYAGLRACEISQLRAEDLWFHADPPVLVVNDGKGGDPGMVPLSPVLIEELRRFDLPRNGWLFPRRDGRPGPLKPWSICGYANRFLHSLGIGGTLHSLRHRFGTQVLRASGNLRHAQEALRHRSVVSTQIYTQVSNTELAAVVSAVPAAVRVA